MLKVLSKESLKELDKKTIKRQGISSLKLMERACVNFIKWFENKFPNTNKIKVFCGSGNNGGDALCISRMLLERNYKVKVFFFQPKKTLSKECSFHLNKLKERKIHVYDINKISINKIKDSDVIIDGLFGYGLSRKLRKSLIKLVNHINSLSAKKISIDMPSGISTEKVLDGVFINSDFTITFQMPKLSFYFQEYLNHIGEVVVLDIGLDKEFIMKSAPLAYIIEENDIKEKLSIRKINSHKGTFGHGLIIAGSKGKMGACIMSCKAALKSGIGLLSAYIPRVGEHMIQTSVPEAMAITDSSMNEITSYPDLNLYKVVGIGPGIGTNKRTEQAFKSFLKNINSPIVIDADAINILSKNKKMLNSLPENSILTPHPKEFKRLAGTYSDTSERIILQKRISKRYKINILVKGAFSMMTNIKGNLFINTTGNPGMATGGSGDVLTGIITGLVGRGYEPFIAMIIGAYIHGLSGDISKKILGEESLTATDLICNLPKAFKKLNN